MELFCLVMWFNVNKAREYLFKYGFVYSLRPKKGRGKENRLEGKDVLMFDTRGKKGMVYFWFVKEIQDINAYKLNEFLADSGFDCVLQWLAKAMPNKFLYLVVLLDVCDFCGRDDFSPEEMYSERQCLGCRQKELEGLLAQKL